MTILLDRRRLIALGSFGIGALAMPSVAAALTGRGFTHGVASGEPSARSVLLWTRFVAADQTALDVELSDSSEFGRIVARAQAIASADRDWCAKATVDGLKPGRWYYYRFRAADGSISEVGRTRTLPDGDVDRFGIGVFSCSNLPFGWFNAYGHAADRRDLDLVVHLGDYLYEYPRGRYPDAKVALTERLIEPAGETIHLADYRLRHAAYRADVDLRRLLQLLPLVAMWDDHESTNNSWVGGAQNHQPATEGHWTVRKQAAARAYREWLPVSDRDYTSYHIGNLATLFRPETRLSARSREIGLPMVASGDDLTATLTKFRDQVWLDPARSMMGAEQERWLADGLRASARDKVRWQLLAQQTIMGVMTDPAEFDQWQPTVNLPAIRARHARTLARSLGLPSNFDQWDGFPASRSRVLGAARDADASLIVLSGDSHNAWAFELDHGGEAAAVELAGQSVTSPGYESEFPSVAPNEVAAALMRQNRQLRWTDTARRGYLTVELTPDRANAEWLFLETVRQRSTSIADRHRMSVIRGTNRFA